MSDKVKPDDQGVIYPNGELSEDERERLYERMREAWSGHAAVTWKVVEPRDPDAPPLPMIHADPLDYDQTMRLGDGTVVKQRFGRTPEGHWRETYRREWTPMQWRLHRLREWFRDLIGRFR